MTCTIDHDAELAIPRDLCRACHPELNLTNEQWTALIQEKLKLSNDIHGTIVHPESD
jgi:hypothetical protein